VRTSPRGERPGQVRGEAHAPRSFMGHASGVSPIERVAPLAARGLRGPRTEVPPFERAVPQTARGSGGFVREPHRSSGPCPRRLAGPGAPVPGSHRSSGPCPRRLAGSGDRLRVPSALARTLPRGARGSVGTRPVESRLVRADRVPWRSAGPWGLSLVSPAWFGRIVAFGGPRVRGDSASVSPAWFGRIVAFGGPRVRGDSACGVPLRSGGPFSWRSAVRRGPPLGSRCSRVCPYGCPAPRTGRPESGGPGVLGDTPSVSRVPSMAGRGAGQTSLLATVA
jgi:hypothetical protein